MRKREKGFTLIELVVVVAILGVLAGVAVPRVLGVLADAKSKSNQANINIIQTAVERYVIDVGNSAANFAAIVSGVEADVVNNAELAIDFTGLSTYLGKVPTNPLGQVYTIRFSTAAGGGFNALVISK